jgi:pimeloyl-ACP methyl ester carboxylesterase
MAASAYGTAERAVAMNAGRTQPLSVETDEGIRLIGEMRGTGESPLVMLLHGGGQTRHAWSATAARLLGEGFDVAAYDARGHGDSGWSPARDYAMPTHARDLVSMLQAVGRPAALVGASMGGVGALLAAAGARALIRALVLVDIVPRFACGGVDRVRAFMQAHPEGFATLVEAEAAVRVYNPNRAAPQNPGGLMRSLRERDGRLHWDPAVIGDPPNEALTALLSERLAALPATLPLLLISGAQSDVVDAAAIDEFRHQAPHAEVIAIARAGHMVAGDRNDAFTDAICDFLQRMWRL